MALDRQSVIRTDFPMSRRGYDRIAVDRHLDEIAQQLDGIERPGASARRRVRTCSRSSTPPRPARPRSSAGRGTTRPASRTRPTRRSPVRACRSRRWRPRSRSLRERLDGLPAPRSRRSRGTWPSPALRTAESEPDVRPAGHDGVRPDRRGRGRRADRPPAPAESRFGREVPATDRRTGWLTQTPVAAPAWSTATTQPAGQEARESARLVALNMADGGQPREATDALPRRPVPHRRARRAARRDLPRPLAALQQALLGHLAAGPGRLTSSSPPDRAQRGGVLANWTSR